MKKDLILLISLAALFFLMPGIVNAHKLDIHEVQERWVVDGVIHHRSVTNIQNFNVNNIKFRGDVYTSDLSRPMPYSYVLYYLDKPTFDTSKTYDLDFIAFTHFSDGKSVSARINGDINCNTVSTSNYISYFSCNNITLVNTAYNYIIVSFNNTGASSSSFSYGLSTLNFVESGTSNRDDILNYISILDDNMKSQGNSIISNQDKNNQEQIDNANKNHDQIMNSDIDDSTKELPDDSSYQDYQNKEDQLIDKMGDADLSNVSIGIDNSSSSFLWATLTSLINTNPYVFSMIISVLSIGIIKLALGR